MAVGLLDPRALADESEDAALVASYRRLNEGRGERLGERELARGLHERRTGPVPRHCSHGRENDALSSWLFRAIKL